jgi:hypothetical protein
MTRGWVILGANLSKSSRFGQSCAASSCPGDAPQFTNLTACQHVARATFDNPLSWKDSIRTLWERESRMSLPGAIPGVHIRLANNSTYKPPHRELRMASSRTCARANPRARSALISPRRNDFSGLTDLPSLGWISAQVPDSRD